MTFKISSIVRYSSLPALSAQWHENSEKSATHLAKQTIRYENNESDFGKLLVTYKTTENEDLRILFKINN